MKISPKDRVFFSKEMHRLAEHFNSKVVAPQGKRMARGWKKEIKVSLRETRKLTRDFNKKGYTSRQWNRLLKTSGAAEKMGVYGGAFKLMTPEHFARIQKRNAR